MTRRQLLALLAAGATGGALYARWRRSPEQRALAELLAQNPLPVTACADRILLKHFFEDSFELRVIERASSRCLAKSKSSDSQLALSFSPDGTQLAFLSARGGDRRFQLSVLDVASGEVLQPRAPITMSAALPIRWCADGSALAYWHVDQSASEVVVVSALQVQQTVPMAPGGDFAWSNDGASLCVVLASTALGIAERGVVKRVEVAGQALQPAWASDDKRIALSARRAERAEIVWIDLATAKETPAMTEPAELADPLCVGDRLVCQARRGAEATLLSAALDGSDRRPFGPRTGKSVARACERGVVYVSHTDRSRPPVLLAVDAAGATVPLSSAAEAGVTATEITLRAADGLAVPAIVWRSTKAVRAALVLVHGGPRQQELAAWDALTAHAARAGFAVIAVNYRGSTGYGASYETAPGDPLLDLFAARDYARQAFSERVFFYGTSYGALLAAEAAAVDAEGAVLVALGAPSRARPSVVRRPPKLFAFQGENDAPEKATPVLEYFFGDGAGRSLTVLRGEGHHFHRLASWARVHAAIEALLG